MSTIDPADPLPPALPRALDAALDERQGDAPAVLRGEGWSAEVQVREAGPIGVVVDRLRVEGQAGDLRQRSEAVVAALRPQGERLHTVELDLALGGAVLRSIPQDMRRGRFFQVDLDATGLELHRHARSRAGGRSAEPFALTRDELGRIIEDIGQIMAGGEIRDGDRDTVR